MFAKPTRIVLTPRKEDGSAAERKGGANEPAKTKKCPVCHYASRVGGK